jgi:hypothetical protein
VRNRSKNGENWPLSAPGAPAANVNSSSKRPSVPRGGALNCVPTNGILQSGPAVSVSLV